MPHQRPQRYPRGMFEAARVRQALREVGFGPRADAEPDGWAAAVARSCAEVKVRPDEPIPTWDVAGHVVRHPSAPPITARTLVCSCAGRACVHLASVLVVLAFADPKRGAALRAPTWEVALAPMARRGDVRPGTRRAAPIGRIRYDLQPPRPGSWGLTVEATIVRDGASPKRLPSTLDALREALPNLSEVDAALHTALQALARARRVERTGERTLTRHLSRALLEPLSRAADVRMGGEPVQVSAAAVCPRLTASRSDGGGLALRWVPAVQLHWRDAGIVLADGRVAPLPEDLPDAVAERLGDPLPAIPRADVERFVDRLVVARGLDVDLPADLPTVRQADGCEARLVLEEPSVDLLQVRLDLVYQRGDGEAIAQGDLPTLVVPGEGQVRRDLVWEADRSRRFAEEVGDPQGHRLRGDDALDFLVDDLPDLATRWPVYGRDGLTRLHVAGSARPAVRFADHQDWFDLDVRFEVAGRTVAAPPILASWRRGLRYHRLDDGSLCRLPSAWLDRHARVVDTLVEVRRAQQRLGTWHAWMASELLEEAGAGRWLAKVRDLAGDIPSGGPPPGLQATLRPYQQRGVDWLRFLRDHGLHGLLADEMGLGKTVQALAVLAEAEGPSLVVAPTSVVPNWCDEAARFAPGLRVLQWHGPRRDPAELARADLVITSYALLRRDRVLREQPWAWVILDEAQQVKNPGSLVARAARQLVARHRLALTGTPLENDLTELWSVFAFLLPGLLGTRKAFHARYAEGSDPALEELRRRIRPFVLRRAKREVAPELPPLSEVTLRVPLSAGERHLYDAVRNTVREALTASTDANRSHVLLDGLTRLRQACCHPALLPFPEARRVNRSSKVEVLLERVTEAIAAGSRCLVFSQWVSLLDRVSEVLTAHGVDHLRLQGATRDRAGVVRAFQAADGPPVLLVSLKAGGTGLNLVAADVVFHLDPWWNPAAEDQATDRAHRIGQDRPVTAYRLVAADTVEDRVLALQAGKRRLFDQTIGRTAGDAVAPTLADLERLV